MKKSIIPGKLNKAKKAYDNKTFIHSRDGRILRILAEYSYPESHLRRNNVRKTVIFFGSARIRQKQEVETEIAELNSSLITKNDQEKSKALEKLDKLKIMLDLSVYYEDAYILAKKIALWTSTFPKSKKYFICTGGGGGIMEAANKGAFDAGCKNVGLNISLPYEQNPNPYITHDLNFEFHYFFMRKFWLVYPAHALIVFPGGFGTLDELTEILTLRQTKKMHKPRMILLYSKQYWSKVLDFDFLIKMGMIDEDSFSLFHFADTPDEAFEIISTELLKNENLFK